MGQIGERLSIIRRRIGQACDRSSRDPADVRLLAVSKTYPAALVREAFDAGQVEFGESRQQEASAKIAELPAAIRWHFIGKIQRNKVRKLLVDFTVFHSVDSLKLAVYMDRIAGELDLRPEAYLEVNIGKEDRKGGFGEDDVIEQIPELIGFGNLKIVGVMVIPPAEDDAERSRRWFTRARNLRDRLQDLSGKELPGLSMGMSGDFDVAIEEGSTIVRVGSALFGDRH